MNVGTHIWQQVWNGNSSAQEKVHYLYQREILIPIRQSFFVDDLIIPTPDPISKI